MKNIWMMLFPSLTADNIYIFLQGMFAAMVLLFILFLLAGITYLIFRRNRQVSGITLNASHGSLFISGNAISDLLYSLDDAFPELEIVRVRLIRDGQALAVQVKVFYSASGNSSMLDLTDKFQTRALELLRAAFGIDNISRIDLVVPKSRL